jgi:hypothetical protein
MKLTLCCPALGCYNSKRNGGYRVVIRSEPPIRQVIYIIDRDCEERSSEKTEIWYALNSASMLAEFDPLK